MARKRRSKQDPVALRGEFSSDLVRWVTSPESEITEEVESVINRVLSDRKKRTQVFLTAMAKKQIERLVFMIRKLPEIEDELLRENRIKLAKTSDLIRLLSLVSQQVSEASEFLRLFVTEDELKGEPAPAVEREREVEVVTQEEKDAAEEINTENRRRVMRVLRKVLNAVETAQRDEDSKKLPEPKKKKG